MAKANVLTLQILNQLPQLIKFTAEHNIDICIQEYRYCYYEPEIKYHDTCKG